MLLIQILAVLGGFAKDEETWHNTGWSFWGISCPLGPLGTKSLGPGLWVSFEALHNDVLVVGDP